MNLSQLMQHVYRDLGKISKGDEFLVTSGSDNNEIENTEISTRPAPYDDNYGYGYTAFVVRDTNSVAPEAEFSVITAYDSATQKWTVSPNFSASLATGDTIALANDDIPLRTMIELANRMLRDLGRIELVDTSLTTVASLGDYSYTLPTAAKYSVRRVEVRDWIDESYVIVYSKDITPSAPGSTGLITLPAQISGLQIKLWYEGTHTNLSVYSSEISETIDDHLAITGLTAYALQWYNGTLAGEDNYWLQRENKAWQDFEAAGGRRPVKKSQKMPKFFVKNRAATKRLSDVS